MAARFAFSNDWRKKFTFGLSVSQLQQALPMRPRSFRRAFSPPPLLLLPLDFAGDDVSEVCTTNLALDWVVHRLVSVVFVDELRPTIGRPTLRSGLRRIRTHPSGVWFHLLRTIQNHVNRTGCKRTIKIDDAK